MIKIKKNNNIKNNIYVEILRDMKKSDWEGNLIFDEISKVTTSINLSSGANGGFYNPKLVRIKELPGVFTINDDESLLFSYRIIEVSSGFLIEQLTTSAFNKFEKAYNEKIEGFEEVYKKKSYQFEEVYTKKTKGIFN